ncbi:MAG: hypothetical protein GWN94_01510 [Phycisphaerae bacterium]|nr:hypothetical protein [Phycisphaerae bacterium]
MLGLSGTYKAIKAANGPAQHIACSMVGITYAGMFYQMVPDLILIGWVGTSVLVALAVIWLNKKILMATLIADFVLSMMVLTFYLMHDPAPVGPVYYSMNLGGVARHAPDEMSMNVIEMFSHGLATVMMALWSLYLANLVHRQILERERMVFVLEGEEVK